jgi:hypothetical protein
MNHMTYLIGVNHTVQHRQTLEGDRIGPMGQAPIDQLKAADIDKLQACLRVTAKRTGATIIAEEFSREAMARSGVTTTTVAEVAQELGLMHLPCDPTTEELQPRTDDRREAFWITRLLPYKDATIIFICGDKHIDTFPAVLSLHGFQSRVVLRGIGVGVKLPAPEYKTQQEAIDALKA